jgi:hypothetical protein
MFLTVILMMTTLSTTGITAFAASAGPIITVEPYSTALTNKNITVTAETSSGKLNAKSHTSTADGSFSFIATDASGHRTTKTVKITNIDKTAPKVTGVSNNAFYNKNRKITFNEGKAKLNGKVFKNGTTVSANGRYTLVVTGSAGNVTTVKFTIDKIKPTITVRNASNTIIANGGTSKTTVTVICRDTNLKSKTAKLNGKTIAWPSNNKFSARGTYTITATDKAANRKSFTFKISK